MNMCLNLRFCSRARHLPRQLDVSLTLVRHLRLTTLPTANQYKQSSRHTACNTAHYQSEQDSSLKGEEQPVNPATIAVVAAARAGR